MMCFRDMTFCGFYKECKDGEECHRALTEEVEYAAKRTGLWISQFADKPAECFAEKEEQ